MHAAACMCAATLQLAFLLHTVAAFNFISIDCRGVASAVAGFDRLTLQY